ncbi:PAS domain-containing protein [Streptomyces sp. WMMC905]|uniref:response regulator n=1 Tax=Streptomyces sp. WMMC905 TaxID=3404123 RepID=UPI003B955025
MSSRPSRGAARLAAILDALPDALVLVNANGTVVNANTIALEAFEAPGTALVGRGLLDLLPDFDSKLIPGSMRRPDHLDPRARTKPTRMRARRTDGSEFPVEVTSANLESGQQAYDGYGHSGAELLMLVVRDLTGTVDTEAELARSQRQTEMILRAAAEGVVGTDTDGRIVLVNPAAAQILGYRAGELGGRELHTLVLHSRADGSPFPFDESPLADTLRSGRKHRVRGQVLYAKDGGPVPVDLTTSPVRDGDQLVGAVMTFTDRRPYDAVVREKEAAERGHAEELKRLAEEHAGELAALRRNHESALAEAQDEHRRTLTAQEERHAALGEREARRHDALSARHDQLLTLLGDSLRGPLEELRRELSALAADDAGQLWPEANQVLHHLSAGYSRITTLIDNVLDYQRLDAEGGGISRESTPLDAVVSAGVDGAVELVGPGRLQFAVHAPPIEARVDHRLLATALAHLVADVAGVDATGNAPVATGGYLDNTVVIAAAQRGPVARVEVRGPYAGGDPVHQPIVRGIVRAHGGVLQTHDVPGTGVSAYVLEVPLDAASPTDLSDREDTDTEAERRRVAASPPAPGDTTRDAEATKPPLGGTTPTDTGNAARGTEPNSAGGGRRRAHRSSVDAFLESEVPGPTTPDEASERPDGVPTGRRRRAAGQEVARVPAQATGGHADGTGRRRGRPAEGSGSDVAEGAVTTAAEHAAGAAASGHGLGGTVPPGGVPTTPQNLPASPRPRGALASSEHRARHESPARHALPAARPAPGGGEARTAPAHGRRQAPAARETGGGAQDTEARQVFALPPAAADRRDGSAAGVPDGEVPRPRAGEPAPVAPPSPAPPSQASPPRAGEAARNTVRDRLPTRPAPRRSDEPGTDERIEPDPSVKGAGPPLPRREAPVAAAARVAPAPSVPGARVEAAPAVPSPTPAGGSAPAASRPDPAPALSGSGPAERPADAPPAEGGAVEEAAAASDPAPDATPKWSLPAAPAAAPTAWPSAPGNGARGAVDPDTPEAATPSDGAPASAEPSPTPVPGATRAPSVPPGATPPTSLPSRADGPRTLGGGLPLPPENGTRAAQPLPAEAAGADSTAPDGPQNGAISVRTLGQGVPFNRPTAAAEAPLAGTAPPSSGPGRRRKLAAPPDSTADGPERPAPLAREKGRAFSPPAGRTPSSGSAARRRPTAPAQRPAAAGPLPAPEAGGRSYAIGAPDENASEGPEPLDGPGGAVEVPNTPGTPAMDDELPPEPLDNPRRVLVWPAPDGATQRALSERGYRSVVAHSREDIDSQLASSPAALFVDPLTRPITRAALQSLRQAAVTAGVPVLVTAGLGQASREAAYGADPAVLLKALAPRDSEQHPPRVLLIEEHAEISLALTGTLEQRGMQVARAAGDADAVALAGQFRPNLVVMDLTQVRLDRTGIVDWLRGNGRLDRTPLVVYTAAVERADLPRLASGETVLFLAERSTSPDAQSRIAELLARIGTN